MDLIEWGAAWKALPGQEESGDLHVVVPFPSGVLVAGIDGLGHGREAAAAARIAAAAIEAHAHESVISLTRFCHEKLHGTRGVVMSLASFNAVDATVTWLAIGNVEGVLLRPSAAGIEAKEHALLRGGVVGYQLPSLRASVFPVTPGDILILATDGIRGGFADGLAQDGSPKEIADRILGRFGKATDDALVLVARYKGIPL